MLDSILLRIAKCSILNKFKNKYSFDKERLLDDYPFLEKDAATFVTLKLKGELRGCIGSLIAHRTLFEDIIHNAVSAGFSDPRFKPLDESELNGLNIEVSVLSKPTKLSYESFEDLCEKLDVNVDGLILEYEQHRGTFLPQVWEQLKTPKSFLEHLSMKAGLDLSIYKKHPNIYRYKVEAIEENFDEILQL